MDLMLGGRTALITGASAGIGRAVARALAAEGCRVAILARRSELLATLAAEIVAAGGLTPLVIVQDLLAAGAVEAIAHTVSDAFGALDILVNNAGGSRPLEGMGSAAEWDHGMRLNFGVGRDLAHAFVPAMRARGFGRIINITGGDEPVALNAAVPPNGAVHLWAKALSRVVAKDGITVNSIPPGRIHSEQVDQRLLPSPEAQAAWVRENCPAGFIGEPEDLAVLVAFLASPVARYITGQVIHVDGGARRFAH
jgi:3-oxoacyl-[acyl-carrier protein] reductase